MAAKPALAAASGGRRLNERAKWLNGGGGETSINGGISENESA
jgi:hypothetical protein